MSVSGRVRLTRPVALSSQFVAQAIRARALPLMAFSVPFVLAGAAVTKAGLSGLLVSHRILVTGAALQIESRIARRAVRSVTISRKDLLGVALLDADERPLMQRMAPAALEGEAVDLGAGGWLLSADESASSSLLFVREGADGVTERLSLEVDVPAECLVPAFESLAERLAG